MLLQAPAMKAACHILVLLCSSSAAEEVEVQQCEHEECRAWETAGSAMLQLDGMDLRKMDGREGLEVDLAADGWDCTAGAAELKGTPKLLQVFVHITDPQLGMLNQYGPPPVDPKTWVAETDMFHRVVTQAVVYAAKGEPDKTPDFLFIGGDMQNFWPNEPQPVTKDDKNQGMTTDLGKQQRKDVQNVMKSAKDLTVKYTAGNHDVGDFPNKDTMDLFAREWGGKHQESWSVGGILYLQFNSQLYWDARSDLNEYRKEQTDWLKKELETEANLIVVLTHIPPFMDKIEEQEGWANWKKEYRTSVLSMFPSKTRSLWVCGHFHANVVNSAVVEGQGGKHEMDIRVTSSAGTTLSWDNHEELKPGEASTIAGMEMKSAFDEHIGSADKKEFAQMDQRKQAVSSKAGMRVFHVYDNHEFKSKWFTLDDLEKVK